MATTSEKIDHIETIGMSMEKEPTAIAKRGGRRSREAGEGLLVEFDELLQVGEAGLGGGFGLGEEVLRAAGELAGEGRSSGFRWRRMVMV